MSFVMLYQLPRSQTNRCLSLKGVVGRDSQLYWMMSDVFRIALPSSCYLWLSTVRVRDVIGPAAARNGERRFLKKRVLTHLQACKVLQKARRGVIRRFGERLNSPLTWVREVVRGDSSKWAEPTLIRLLDEGEVVRERHLFFVWYVFFRKRVTEKVYGRGMVEVLGGMTLTELCCGKEREKPFLFPGSILLMHGDKTVRYVREPE